MNQAIVITDNTFFDVSEVVDVLSVIDGVAICFSAKTRSIYFPIIINNLKFI